MQRAADQAEALGRPLLVVEALRCGYPWASERLHRAVLDGMAANAAHFARTPALYHPYVEPRPGDGAGLIEALAAGACLVVTDHFPCFFLPRMVAAAAAKVQVRLEAVDGNGLLPLALGEEKTTAHSFRRLLQKTLPPHLSALPLPDPLAGRVLPRLSQPPAALRRWPAADLAKLDLSQMPIDHDVGPVPSFRGGFQAAEAGWTRFRDARLARYPEDRNHPDQDGQSGLSPWLHFGHLSIHQVFAELAAAEGWTPARLGATTGQKAGWWGMSPAAEAFLDEAVTWREVGYNLCHWRPAGYDRYSSLPAWAQTTLAEHAADKRPRIYTLDQLAAAETADPVWNAAQRQLRREGRIHTYLRMLWGKNALAWTRSPPEALEILIELNNRYALDGRDPNSYSGIFWVFGRFDRAWGPERPIYGKVRYMTSENTRRKLDMDEYLRRYGPSS